MPQTIFCDIDGTVVDHSDQTKLLPGVKEQFKKWVHEECMIILTTGRKESLRDSTVAMLAQHGLPYDLLIMGLPRGERIVINDRKPTGEATVGCYNPYRNEGLTNYHPQYIAMIHMKKGDQGLVMERVNKPWGHEEWLELNDKYCYKRIFFKAGNRCSLQYHEKKLETIYVESGEGKFIGELPLIINGELNPMMKNGRQEYVTINMTQYSLWTVPIKAGDSFTIYPKTLHRIEAITDLTTLEVSTPEVDDCIRVQDDSNRPNGRIKEEHE